jgi:hypothetical protein
MTDKAASSLGKNLANSARGKLTARVVTVHPRKRIDLNYVDIACLVIPITVCIQFDLIGQLFVPDIVLTAVAVASVLVRPVKLFSQLMSKTLILAGLWFIGAVMTDLFRETAFDDLARGWSRLIFYTLDTAGLYVILNGRIKRLLLYAAGLMIGYAIKAYANPDLLAIGDDWKFGYAFPVTVTVIIIAEIGLFGDKVDVAMKIVIVFAIAFLNLAFNFRSMFGTVIAAISFYLALRVLKSKRTVGRVSLWSLAGVFVALFIVLQGAVAIYYWTASEGILGLEAKNKFEAQTGGDLGLILGGRTESVVSTKAIWDSPVLGHGSWARDMSYKSQEVDILEAAGVQIEGDPFADDLIPAHSHILGAWVEHGLFGGIFWIWIFWLILRAILSMVYTNTNYEIFLGFFLILGLWNLLFSPMGGSQRLADIVPICAAILVVEAGRRKSNVLQVERDQILKF